MRVVCIFLMGLLGLSGRAFAAEYRVSSVEEFAALRLNAGDVVVWKNGEYAEAEKIIFAADGTAQKPITLKAESPGGVVFTGGMTMNISGDHVVVEGFYWKGGEGQNNHIQFRQNSDYAHHSTLRNCAINDLTPSKTDKHRWVVLYGTNNTIERCSFVNKRSPGALILVELSYNGSERVSHQIRKNYFYNYEHRDPKSVHSGDSETIRIGASKHQAKDASTLVEGNYFQACDGENEIITNKSKNNRFLRNTFRKCRGSLVLRHGASAWVEGNFFLGEGKKNTGGVRVSDSFHTIINNYFQGLSNDGSKWNNAITLVGGSDESGGATNGYQKVDDILVAFNTVYGCDGPLFYNDRSSYDPTGLFAYNLLFGNRTVIVGGDIKGTGKGVTYKGNLVIGQVNGVGINEEGMKVVKLEEIDFKKEGEIYKPSKKSVVVGAAKSEFSKRVKYDLEGRLRVKQSMDVGAHEVSAENMADLEGKKFRPFVDSDVGVSVGAGFLDSRGK